MTSTGRPAVTTREEASVADFNMAVGFGIGWAGEWCPDPSTCEGRHCYGSMGVDKKRVHPLEPERFEAWLTAGRRFSAVPLHLRIGEARNRQNAMRSQEE